MPSSLAPPQLTQLSYANANQPWVKRWFIRSVERLSGQSRYVGLYERWRREFLPNADRPFGHMLDLIDVRLSGAESWPSASASSGPLVVVANHPFGIGDGIAILALVERLGRPFRVMINAELLKVKELERFSLPVDFSDSKEALRNNLRVRHEAMQLLRSGVTIVVFPAGGVATAATPFGPAIDLPWKLFPAKLIQEVQASVTPVHFAGQNGRLFHLVSQPMHLLERNAPLARRIGAISLSLRTSLLLREFTRLRGKTIDVTVGEPIEWPVLEPMRERRVLTDYLRRAVFRLGQPAPEMTTLHPMLQR